MTLERKPLVLLLAIAMSAMTGCKKDSKDETPANQPNEEELITTLILTFTDQEVSTEVFHLRFTDTDGAGGNAPVIVADTLPAGRAFGVAVRVLNESVNPAQEVSDEISAEAVAHQFFFQSTVATLSIAYADADANGHPIGLTNTAVTGTAGTGMLTVTLRHLPDKGAAGVSAGDITNAGGETDIEVQFPVVIE